jgi:SAM-dependent methyltransferase
MNDRKYLQIVRHYEKCLESHGDSHLGVDWPKLEDVDKRYQVMLDLLRFRVDLQPVSLLDFGCGAAHLYEYILRNKIEKIDYSGLEISNKFFSLCQSKYSRAAFYCLDILKDATALPSFDYVVMNGVFTEKRELTFEEMLSYWKDLVSATFAKTRKGMAFNVMSKHVDWEREDLFHLPFDTLAEFLRKKISRNFIIRNDYGLYEYTVYVYKD